MRLGTPNIQSCKNIQVKESDVPTTDPGPCAVHGPGAAGRICLGPAIVDALGRSSFPLSGGLNGGDLAATRASGSERTRNGARVAWCTNSPFGEIVEMLAWARSVPARRTCGGTIRVL